LFAAERVDHAHAALAVLLDLNGLRVSEACSADIENLGFERGHRTLRIVGKGNKPALIPLVPRTARTVDLAVGERDDRSDPASPRRQSPGPAHRPPVGTIHRQAGRHRRSPPAHAASRFIMCALEAGVPLREVQIAARHADPRTTTVYDHRRQSFDRHAAYVVVAFVAGG
jgi:integrase/recombinase XerD